MNACLLPPCATPQWWVQLERCRHRHLMRMVGDVSTEEQRRFEAMELGGD